MKLLIIGCLATVLINCGLIAEVQSQDKPAPSKSANAGTVLRSVFDVSRSSRIKTRSLMQRTFLDTVGKREQPLQVAFVIDGTDSMGTDIRGVLDSLKSMVTDLQRHKSDASKVSYGLVVYRDVKSPSGAVELPMGKQFTSDLAELERVVGGVKTETGAPYFEEAVDVGLNDALTSLLWSDEPEAVRWVIVIGDAPPYPDNFDKDGAKRVYTTNELVETAKAKKAIVHCVLCSSGFSQDLEGTDEQRRLKLRKSYDVSLSSTRTFMKELTEKTSGIFLDLSRDDLVQTMVGEAKRSDVAYQAIEPIVPGDIEAFRVKAVQAGGTSFARIAVLPHLPLKSMKFDGDLPAVQVATLMREKLRLLPKLEIQDASDVVRAFDAVKLLNLDDGEMLQRLATDLRVDYVVWGSLSTDKMTTHLKSSVYRRVNATAIAEAELTPGAKESAAINDELAQNRLAQTVIESLLRNAKRKLDELEVKDGLAVAYDTFENAPSIASPFSAPLSNSLRASREMLAGLNALEQAVGFPRGSPAAAQYLATAKLKLGAAALLDPENPLIFAWLATAHYNSAVESQSQESVANYRQALDKAYAHLDKATGPTYRSLIEAQHALVISQDVPRAIEIYESLLTSKTAQLDAALKAHWMLAGIYAGDWEVPVKSKNPAKAREHVIQILANWPNSKEASYLKESVRWDEQEGSLHPHLALMSSMFVE